jgi:hypothetical protein
LFLRSPEKRIADHCYTQARRSPWNAAGIKDDQDVRFWIPEDEFRGMTIFPDERTAYFKEGESLGLETAIT